MREYQCFLEYNGRMITVPSILSIKASNITEVVQNLTQKERAKLLKMENLLNSNSTRAYFLKKEGFFRKNKEVVYLIKEVG